MKNKRYAHEQESDLSEIYGKIEQCSLSRSEILEIGPNLNLAVFPEEIRALTWLTSLTVTCTGIEELPDWISELKDLKSIDLSHNRLQTLPESFGSLSALEEFYLHETNNHPSAGGKSSWFSKIPDSFGNLASLKIFDIYDTQLSELPESFGNLLSLKSLSVQSDAQLPDTFYPGTMKNLKSVTEISINGFSKVPGFIAELENLTKLDISHNRLYTLPDFIGKLTKLKTLNLHSTWITELPDWIVNLKQLNDLDISSNEISADPELYNKMPKLNKLI